MDFPVEIDIPGKFSIYNSLTAIAICRHFKVSQENILKALKVAKVKGRIEMVKVSDEFTLMIDYAHNACLAVAETAPGFAVMRWEKFPVVWQI